MGMSNYILGLEEVFEDSACKIVTESETWDEALDRCLAVAKPLVPHLGQEDICEIVSEIWNDYWSNYL